MFPLTVKQVEKATPSDNGYEIYGINISTVKIMGFIEHSEEHATNKTYVINDGTGAIQCILYTTENVPTFSNYTYVKVFGNIRSLEGTTKLYVFHMSEVTVLDEMTYHILDCIHNFCKLTKQDKNATVCMLSYIIIIIIIIYFIIILIFIIIVRGLTTPQGNFGKQSIKNESTSSGTKDAVLQAIANAGTSEEGVSIELICRALQNKYSRDEIRKHCADLCDEGSIYSTIDEDHFLASG